MEPELAEVRILGLPVVEQRLAAEHFDELVREFTLLQLSGSGAGVPARLVELRDELASRFEAFIASNAEAVVAAAERGDETVDLTYRIPTDIGPAAQRLSQLLDEADAYCREGEHLLTLETPERTARYRRWVLGEFTRQLAGAAPTPWAAYDG